MGSLLVGDVLKEQWRSMAGGEEWRRPWWRAVVPAEGPVKMGRQGAHKHQGEVGMQFPYPIWPRMWRKGVVDGGANLELLR
jgi:hypothetical protein